MTSFGFIVAPSWGWGSALELMQEWGLLRKMLNPPPEFDQPWGREVSPLWGTSPSTGGPPGVALVIHLPL